MELDIQRIENHDDFTEYLLSIHSILKDKTNKDSEFTTTTSYMNGFVIKEKKKKEKILDEYLLVTNGYKNPAKIITEYSDTDFVCDNCNEKKHDSQL